MAKSITFLMVTILSIAAVVCVLNLPECAAQSNSSLTVTVRNQLTSAPIVGANVSISGPANQLQVTGASGTVVFSNIHGYSSGPLLLSKVTVTIREYVAVPTVLVTIR